MKHFIKFLALGLLALASCTQSYKIVITFPDASTDGQTVYLTSYDSGDTLQQAEVKNKCAVLEGTVDKSYMARLLVDGKRLGFVVESGEIAIMWKDHKVTGTPLNEKMNEFDKKIENVPDSLAAPEFYKLYEENRDNGIGPWAFNYYLMMSDFSVAQLDSVLKTAPADYRQLKRVEKAINAAKQLEITAIGKQFTDFAAPDGKKLSEYAGTGKYTLVDFWASWCGPCRREIPNIKKLYDKYNGKMNFVGVAVWDKPDDTRKAMQELQIPWPVLEGGQNWTMPTDLYGISGIPHIMLIDPNGVIVARGLEGEVLIKTIEDLKL